LTSPFEMIVQMWLAFFPRSLQLRLRPFALSNKIELLTKKKKNM